MHPGYIDRKEYPAFGLSADTPDSAVIEASTVVDEILMRPEGLIWIADATGAPAYMAAKSPSMVYTLGAAITAGRNVVATITPAAANPDLVGEVLVLDRGKSTPVEACVVTAVAADGGSVTLEAVKFDHVGGIALELGLTISEERSVAANRQIARISRTPCAAILAMQGRYGYGRRSDQIAGRFQDDILLAMTQPFGGPLPWMPIPPSQVSVSSTTGQVFVPVGMYLSAFSDVRVRYLAGYPVGGVPGPIKVATAQLVRASAATGEIGIPSGIKMYKAGNTAFTRFSASLIDPDTARMLAPYKAMTFY